MLRLVPCDNCKHFTIVGINFVKNAIVVCCGQDETRDIINGDMDDCEDYQEAKE